MAAINRCYSGYVSSLGSLAEFECLFRISGGAGTKGSRLLFGTHPLGHLLVIDWLFDSWEEFLSAYDLVGRRRNPAK